MGVVALLVWHSGLMEAFRVRTFFLIILSLFFRLISDYRIAITCTHVILYTFFCFVSSSSMTWCLAVP